MERGSRADHGINVTLPAAPGIESHGVHVCSKCGWPFPNPHPNARHRRAHRKICGTLPGYSLIPESLQTTTAHSPVSDDDQHTDEDLKTPSPKGLERSRSEMSSGGTMGRSNRSEDDVFTDAVDDFADAGAGSAARFQQCLDEGFEGMDDKDTANAESLGGTSDQATQVQIPEGQPDGVVRAAEEGVVPIAATDLTGKELGDESANAEGLLMSDLNPMISGDQMNDSGEVVKDNANDLKDTSQEGNDRTIAEVHAADGPVVSGDSAAVDLCEGMANTEKAVVVNSSSEPNFGISEHEEEHTATVEELPLLKEEFHEKLETGSALDDVKSTSASVDMVEVKVDAPLTPASASSSVSVEGANSVDDENAHVLSVHGDIKYVDNAEVMVEGYKGEGSGFPQTVNLGSIGITNDVKDSSSSMEDTSSSSPTGQLVEETLSTASEVQVLGDSPEVKDESSTSIESSLGSSAEVLLGMNQQVPSADREAQHLERPADTHSGDYECPNNEGSDVGDNSKMVIAEPRKEDSQEPSEPDNIIFEKARLHGQLDRPDNDVTEAENSAPSSFSDQNDNQAASEADNIIFENERLHHGQLDMPDVTGAENSAPSSLVDQNVSMKIKETLEPEIEHTQTGVSQQGIQEAKSIDSISLKGVNSTDCQAEIIERDVTPAAETGGSVPEKPSVGSKAMLESTDDQESSTLSDKLVNATERQLEEESACIDMDEVSNTETSKLETESAPGVGVTPVSTDVHESSTVIDKLVNATESQLKEESACIDMDEVSNTDPSLEKLKTESAPGVGGTPQSDKGNDAEVLHKSSQVAVAANGLLTSSAVKDDVVSNASHGKPEPSFCKEADSSTKQLGTSAADFSVDSNSQTDSLEGHWGSVSDMPVCTTKTNAPQDSDKTDTFEAPSFMTLVEPRTAGDQKSAASEIHSAQNPQQSKAQAGWFPSITNVVNESQGRKKNEEIIAKVTNWSNAGKQHTPLKSLLGEANQELKSRPSPTHVKKGNAADKGRDDDGVRSAAAIQQEKEGAARKEWSSPARYPTAEIQREKKRKEKGRPYWAHLVCCASVN